MLALIGVTTTVIGVGSPLLLSMLNGHQMARARADEAMARKAEKEQDYARLDAVAEKAEATAARAAARAAEVADQAVAAAQLLLDQQSSVATKAAEAAALLLESNKQVADTAQLTNEKLDVIHVPG